MMTTTAAKSSKRTATHNGTCQVCGRVQAVHPITGHLAKHGYTTRWGFFSGTCPGSDHKPFEVSKALIESAIARAKDAAVTLREQAAEVRARTEGKVWFQFYRPATWQVRHSSNVWREVDIFTEEKTYQIDVNTTGSYFKFFVENPYYDEKAPTTYGNLPREEVRYSGDEVAEVRTALNEKRAKSLDAEAKKYDEYVVWQTERVANWAPADLKPRKA